MSTRNKYLYDAERGPYELRWTIAPDQWEGKPSVPVTAIRLRLKIHFLTPGHEDLSAIAVIPADVLDDARFRLLAEFMTKQYRSAMEALAAVSNLGE